jgi:O-methyltransferase
VLAFGVLTKWVAEVQEEATDRKKFNTRSAFPHTLPYDEAYAERVPLLQAFRMAIDGCRAKRRVVRGILGKIGLDALLQRNWAEFCAAECGVYAGNALLACALIARDSGLPVRLYGLDTFTGLPSLSSRDLEMAPSDAPYLKTQYFNDVPMQMIQDKLRECAVDGQVTLMQGLFRDTLPLLPKSIYFFVHIDCDLYDPHLECLEYFYPRMERGGVIFFDDYHSKEFPMARAAIDTFLKGRPERLFHLRYGQDRTNFTKAFIVKY